MENEDEQKHNTNDAGPSTNCDTNIHTTATNEVQNRYVVRIYSKYITKTALCHYKLLRLISHIKIILRHT